MQKFFNNKVMAVLGLIASVYVIVLLVLLIFATVTLLKVATIFYVLMWVAMIAGLLVIAGLLYIQFAEKRKLTKYGISLLVAHAVSVLLLIFKGLQIMNALAKLGSLYNSLNSLGQYGGGGTPTTPQSGAIGSLLFSDAGATIFIVLLTAANVVILAFSAALLGKVTVAEELQEPNVESINTEE